MSFPEQERALFDLLFDGGLREHFCRDGIAALAAYDLSGDEQADFGGIRPGALQLDAKMRRDFLLTHLCRAFPVSFALLSSLADGRDMLKALIDTQSMRASSLDRPALFGTCLREKLTGHSFDTPREQTLVIAILEAELAMAMTAAALKREVLESGEAPAEQSPMSGDWERQPVKLAAFVGAALVPRSYAELKRSLCKVADGELWAHLRHNPVSRSLRHSTLAKEEPRLLVVRACIEQMSRCEPVVKHQTAELSEGFAPLFQHINGTLTVAQILEELGEAGAPDQILKGVQAGFRQLLENAMLALV